MMTPRLNPLLEQWNALRFWKEVYEKRKIRQRVLDRERLSGKPVLPPKELWFRALEYTDPATVKCVILGQDPYHTPGLAHGLAFSVMPDKKIPPSLREIFKEYQEDLGYPPPMNGYLRPWCDNGVLLLNTCLTVDTGKAGSHSRLFDWELLTYEILRLLSSQERPIAFVFWGKHAEEFSGAISNSNVHGVVISGHPSPLAAGSKIPFRGSSPFSKVNTFLSRSGVSPIYWRLPSRD